jgi:hypothetical protein
MAIVAKTYIGKVFKELFLKRFYDNVACIVHQ